MNVNRIYQMTMRLMLILSMGGLVACGEKEEIKQDPTAAGSLVGMNYTGDGIQRFSVGEAGGGGINRYGISGNVCCVMYPRKWIPDYKVKVEWERSDGREPDGKRWKLKTVEKIVTVEKYTEVGEVYVVFLPNDDVRVYVSTVGPKNKDFPSKLGKPQDPEETRSNTP